MNDLLIERPVLGMISKARDDQVEKGWTPAHDTRHIHDELVHAAISYLDPPRLSTPYWPWDLHDFKPRSRRENLVRAAALIVAELEQELRRQPHNVGEQ